MARRHTARTGRPKPGRPRLSWRTRAALLLNLAVLLVGGVWYAVQPPSRQEEVRILLGNALQRHKRIHLWEVAWDLYTLYYGHAFVPSSFAGGHQPVYAGLPRSNGIPHSIRVLPNTGFVVGYCEAWGCPAWVAYRLFDVPGNGLPPERPGHFDVDPRTAARIRPEDYTGTGFDRGHLAPNFGIARCYGPAAQQETFLMSNMVPQRHALNAGMWRDLELREALNYAGRFREIWVITGPLFLGEERRLDAGVRIPDAFFKIEVDEHEGGIRAQAFILKQDAAADEKLAVFLTTVDEVERLSGLDFFGELEGTVESKLEAARPTSAW
jgi:endonuclease G, mitochondrial